MKNILGLDLGTTSIGWAFVKEAESDNETSSIERIGVRVNPLTTDEQTNFEKGKPLTENADRTLKRSMRRNLSRYKLRRSNLIDTFIKNNIIKDADILAEHGKNTTHITYAMRAKAASEKVDLLSFAKVLLMINKKRGYKSSRKAKNEDEGQVIDGMSVAKTLYEQGITPGQYSYQLLLEGKTSLPDFYRSDLHNELNKIWEEQKLHHPEIFTDEFKKEIEDKGQRATAAIFWSKYGFNTADIKGSKIEKRLKAFQLRNNAINTALNKEEAAYVIADVNGNIHSSSGYLGAISDRSKKLYFDKITVGQFLYQQLINDPHTRLKNQVFYRQDYLDEFEVIWETQAKFHKELTQQLKKEVRDIIIFYQRKLRSQKGLVSFCEFERKEVETIKNGKKTTQIIGARVAPKSSPLFQEFKIWQNLHNLIATNIETKEQHKFGQESKQSLFEELNIKGNLSDRTVLKLLGYSHKEWTLNYDLLEGNKTNKALYEAYLKILELEGHDIKNELKINKDHIDLTDVSVPAAKITDLISSLFNMLGINTEILPFDTTLDSKAIEQQASYNVWHLLYSFQEDNTQTGNAPLYNALRNKFGFTIPQAKILAGISLPDDYGSLSAKAIKKILPYLKDGHPYAKSDKEKNIASATALAGYNHSSSLTKEELDKRVFKDKLELLPKNSLRSPVVEKILNQMVNVINMLIDEYSERDNNGNIIKAFKFDEIRIELSRELKNNAKERERISSEINKATIQHDRIRKKIIADFPSIKAPSRNDIIRYKLYEELKFNGYKDIYTNEKIDYWELFTNKYDIDHIIPQQILFDDSYSNKVLVPRSANLKKSNRTAYNYILEEFGEKGTEDYIARVNALLEYHKKDNPNIKAKQLKLLKHIDQIGKGFIERDLRESQYIAKKAKSMLGEISYSVLPTTGKITDRLREDWGIMNVLKELNINKYRQQGLTEVVEKRDGGTKEIIIDWTKRSDHRHHAMDALIVAFTKRQHIQYLNHLNARKDATHEEHYHILGIEKNETQNVKTDNGGSRRVFNAPMPNFRREALNHLENILVSIKAKNKVVTKNKNKYKAGKSERVQTTLTPRGRLHEETIYGKILRYSTKEVAINAFLDLDTAKKIANKRYRTAILRRLEENNNNPKKAFSGVNAPSKKPIYIDDAKSHTVPNKVKLSELLEEYTIRKDVNPDNFKTSKNIEKVIDPQIKELLLNRLLDYDNNAIEAFSNLDKYPIWLNKEKGISIKRVKISAVKTAEPIHIKRDHLGKVILDQQGQEIPSSYIRTGNNHHVAIYIDEQGYLYDEVVTFFEAVTRAKEGYSIIDKQYNNHLGWKFLFSMKKNEYFVFPSNDFSPFDIDLKDPFNNKVISRNLFKVREISKKSYSNSIIRNYGFQHHLETQKQDKNVLKDITFKDVKSLSDLKSIIKVRIDHIGRIVKVGEY